MRFRPEHFLPFHGIASLAATAADSGARDRACGRSRAQAQIAPNTFDASVCFRGFGAWIRSVRLIFPDPARAPRAEVSKFLPISDAERILTRRGSCGGTVLLAAHQAFFQVASESLRNSGVTETLPLQRQLLRWSKTNAVDLDTCRDRGSAPCKLRLRCCAASRTGRWCNARAGRRRIPRAQWRRRDSKRTAGDATRTVSCAAGRTKCPESKAQRDATCSVPRSGSLAASWT